MSSDKGIFQILRVFEIMFKTGAKAQYHSENIPE